MPVHSAPLIFSLKKSLLLLKTSYRSATLSFTYRKGVIKMSSVEFIKKTPAGSLGNFNYEYKCKCADSSTHIIKVTTTNDNQAKQLAELECSEKCEKSK